MYHQRIWLVAKRRFMQNVLIQQPKPSLLWRIFKAFRALSLTATVMPIVATWLFLLTTGHVINSFNGVTAILAVMCLQISVNVFNDIADHNKKIDLPGTLGGSGVIQQGWLSASQMSFIGWLSLMLAFILGLPSLLFSPMGVSICAVFALIGVLGYSGKPFYFKYVGLGDVLVWLLCGPILVAGFSFAITAQLMWPVLLIGAYFGFIAAAILNANNINDMAIDAASGAKTLAIKLGFERARRLQLFYYVGAFSMTLGLFYWLGFWVVLPWLALPLVMGHIRCLMAAPTGDHASLSDVRFNAAKLHLVLGLLLSASVGLALVFRV